MAASFFGPIRPAPASLPAEPTYDSSRPSYAAGLLEWADWAAERLLFQVSAAYDTNPEPRGIGAPCPKLEAVRLFLRRRFTEEEQRMRESGYPNLAVHVAAHEAILVRLATLNRSLRYGRYDQIQFLDLLESWIVDHIERHDKPFGWFYAWHEARPDTALLTDEAPVEERRYATH